MRLKEMRSLLLMLSAVTARLGISNALVSEASLDAALEGRVTPSWLIPGLLA